MERLLDPETLRGRGDVEFRTERTADEREGFDYFAAIDGLELGWFDAVPDDAYWDNGDAVDDLRIFVQ